MATPLMEQYFRLKSEAGECFLFFRMGDFYELFFEDAQKVSQLLGLTLTARGTHDDSPIPMCGIPWGAAADYVSRLTQMGYRVAIAEQVSDPKESKGLVDRAIVRIASQSQPFDPLSLSPAEAVPLCVFLAHNNAFAVGDPTTLTVQIGVWTGDLAALCQQHQVCELVLVKGTQDKLTDLGVPEGIPVQVITGDWKEPRLAFEWVLSERSKRPLTVNPISADAGGVLSVDAVSVQALNLLPGAAGDPSLFGVLGTMKTPMGLRLLRRRILQPLGSLSGIHDLQKQVQSYSRERLNSLRPLLGEIKDIDRMVMKLLTSGLHGKEALALSTSMVKSCEVLGLDPSPYLEWVGKLQAEPALTVKEGNVMGDGVDPQLDQIRQLKNVGTDFFVQYEQQLRDQTQISNLKIKYSRVFGYTIEVTSSHLAKVPSFFIRRQTIAGGERFVTADLLAYQDKLANAEEQRVALETRLWQSLVSSMQSQADRMQVLAAQVAQIDYCAGLAQLAFDMGHLFPEVVLKGDVHLPRSRHPILEKQMMGRKLVPNDIHCSEEQPLTLLTGPNMAGKSTLMKQTALLCLMAHLGAALPVGPGAQVPLMDGIYTRVGSGDRLFENQSTFMVEMVETARILRSATARSFVLMDEVGRGTSTFDGMSIAWSILEYLARKRVRGFFATHYHELTQLPESFPTLVNKHVAVLQKGNSIQYLYKMSDGPSPGSFGIQVASLAGLPKSILDRAKTILGQLENGSSPTLVNSKQMSLFGPDPVAESSATPLLDRLYKYEQIIEKVDLDDTTPRQALRVLEQLKELH